MALGFIADNYGKEKAESIATKSNIFGTKIVKMMFFQYCIRIAET